MNERIRELAEQAEQYALSVCKNNGHFHIIYREKFAEVIVHQLLDITDAHTEVFQTDRDKALIEHIKQSVKQHFGVEE